MRRAIWAGMILGLVIALAGCGGGDSAPLPLVTAGGNELRLNYLHGVQSVAQATIQDTYTLQAKLWMPQSAPLLSALALDLPAADATSPWAGPSLLPSTDGTNQSGVPIAVLWGAGTRIPTGQPVIVPRHASLPGYRAPDEPLYVYRASATFADATAVSGRYALTGNDAFAREWVLPGMAATLPAPVITKPTAFEVVLNAEAPIEIAWDPVPGAVGYLVTLEADVRDDNQQVVGRIVWSSADRPVILSALFDVMPVLMPASTTTVTVPATIFNGCQALTVTILAHGAPLTGDANGLALHVANASMISRVYGVIQH